MANCLNFLSLSLSVCKMGPRGPTVRSVSEKDKVNVIPDSCQASSGAVVASLGAWRTEDIPGKHAFFQTRQSFDSNTWMASSLAERAVSYVSLFCPFYFRARGGPGNFFFFFFCQVRKPAQDYSTNLEQDKSSSLSAEPKSHTLSFTSPFCTGGMKLKETHFSV